MRVECVGLSILIIQVGIDEVMRILDRTVGCGAGSQWISCIS